MPPAGGISIWMFRAQNEGHAIYSGPVAVQSQIVRSNEHISDVQLAWEYDACLNTLVVQFYRQASSQRKPHLEANPKP